MTETVTGEGLAESAKPPGTVFRSWRFLGLFFAQGVSQMAQSAILFTLLILVLRDTDSTFNTSVLVFTFIIPSLLFGVAAGVLVDRWDKRNTIVYTSLLRMAACLGFLFVYEDLIALYAMTLAFSTVSQFFSPAVIALIPATVRREQLIVANSVFNLTLMLSQFAGLVFLGPALLISFGADMVFAVTSVLYTLAALIGLALPHGDHDEGVRLSTLQELGLGSSIVKELERGWQLLRGDPIIGLATTQLVLSATLVMLFTILVPRFLRDVLELDPDKAVLVFAPVGVGAILGLRLLPWLGARMAKHQMIVLGLAGIGVSVILMSFIEPLGSLLAQWEPLDPFEEDLDRLAGLTVLAAVSMAVSLPLGLSYAIVNSPAQTILHERTPAEMRARVFATQLTFANIVSILPLLAVGGITDAIGISMMLFLLGLSIG
ncbi:MAG TPA: MFS transporter, partial [Castellaniella sp.]|nr:MFS transporter [Castellaniella sp.]